MTESIKTATKGEIAILNPEGVVQDAREWAQKAGSTMGWTWLVVYRNPGHHSFIAEYDEDGGVRGWGTVDLDRVEALALIPLKPNLSIHEVTFAEGDRRKPVFFRRFSIAAEGYIDPSLLARCVHCIGWTKGDVEHYQFYFEDGSSVSGSDLNRV